MVKENKFILQSRDYAVKRQSEIAFWTWCMASVLLIAGAKLLAGVLHFEFGYSIIPIFILVLVVAHNYNDRLFFKETQLARMQYQYMLRAQKDPVNEKSEDLANAILYFVSEKIFMFC